MQLAVPGSATGQDRVCDDSRVAAVSLADNQVAGDSLAVSSTVMSAIVLAVVL